jgi:hypothetical protein
MPPNKVPPRLFSNRTKVAIKITLIVVGLLLAWIGTDLWNTASAEQQYALDPSRGQVTSPKIDPTQPIFVDIGGAGNNFTYQELTNGIDLNRLIQLGNITFPIKITCGQDGSILVSVSILDENRNILARVINNEWKAPSGNSLEIWYKNYNSYAFEVIYSNGIPVFQMFMPKTM